MDLSPKKRFLPVRKHIQNQEMTVKQKKDQHHIEKVKNKLDFNAKIAMKQLFYKKEAGLLSGGRSSVSVKCNRYRETGLEINRAVRRGDLHTLLAMQSKPKPSIETLFKIVEKDTESARIKNKKKTKKKPSEGK